MNYVGTLSGDSIANQQAKRPCSPIPSQLDIRCKISIRKASKIMSRQTSGEHRSVRAVYHLLHKGGLAQEFWMHHRRLTICCTSTIALRRCCVHEMCLKLWWIVSIMTCRRHRQRMAQKRESLFMRLWQPSKYTFRQRPKSPIIFLQYNVLMWTCFTCKTSSYSILRFYWILAIQICWCCYITFFKEHAS